MEIANYIYFFIVFAIGTSQQYNEYDVNMGKIYFSNTQPKFGGNFAESRNAEPNYFNGLQNSNVQSNAFLRNTGPSTALTKRINARNVESNENYGEANVIKTNDLSKVMTDFGLRTMMNLQDTQSENIVFSPLSIGMSLGLLQQGAVGETLDQLNTLLRMKPEETRSFYKTVLENVKNRKNERNILNIATNLFIANAFDINPNFKKNATYDFGSEVTPLSFANAVEASQKINSWIAYNTKNRIDKLVSPDAIDVNTQLVLTNAVFFKGLWRTMFNPEATLPRNFYIREDETKNIPFMRIKNSYKIGYDQETNAEVVILPFEKEEYSLMIILPVELSSCASVLSSLSHLHLKNYHKFPIKEINLEMPKFTVRANTDLKTLLKKMGITNVFSQKSELFKLGTYRNFSPQITTALHTAVLSIDEKGGTAAAATAFAAVALSYDDSSFKVNRPFLAVLWDNNLSLPLFMAKIQDPTL